MSPTTNEIIRALTCSATPGGAADDVCQKCRYAIMEEFGGEELISCDCDKIALDAAYRLEQLVDGKAVK